MGKTYIKTENFKSIFTHNLTLHFIKFVRNTIMGANPRRRSKISNANVRGNVIKNY